MGKMGLALTRLAAAQAFLRVASAVVCGATLFIFMVGITIDALSRYAFNYPLKGVYEASEIYLLPALIFLPLAYIQAKKRHIAVELVTSRLPARARGVISVLTGLAVLLFWSLLSGRVLAEVWQSWEAGSYKAGVVELAMWPSLLMIPLGGGLLCLQSIIDVVDNVSNLVQRTTSILR